MKKIISQSKNQKAHFYGLNVAPDELIDYKKILGSGKINSIAFEQLKGTKSNSLVIVEDIIHLSTSDAKNLRTSLNYDAHHKNQKNFCVTHSMYKTSIWSMLSFFHFIIFSSASSNIPVIRICLKIYFKVEKSIIENWIYQFKILGKEQKDAYFYFDCSSMKFYFSKNLLDPSCARILSDNSKVSTSLNSKSEENEKEELLELRKRTLEIKFEKFCEGHPFKLQATAVFSILINCLNLELIRNHDLTIKFKTKKNTEKRISLVDYISALLDSTNKKTHQDLLVLHKYVTNFCNIPSIFILNTNFDVSTLRT